MSNKSLTIICCLFNEYNILEKNFKHCIKEINSETFYEEIIFIDNNSKFIYLSLDLIFVAIV